MNSKQKEESMRRFQVGIVGANNGAFAVIGRIFHVTGFRTRRYEPVSLAVEDFRSAREVDVILMCSSNESTISAWEQHLARTTGRPMVYLTRPDGRERGRYQLAAPVNPSRLVKLLDQYTIKELNFFPEFKIGSESGEIEEVAAAGIKLLRNAKQENAKQERDAATGKALVVDDSLAVRRQMQIEFELRNVNLDVAANAEQAMAAISRAKYDLIFLDVVMPGIDGYTVCKRIKRCPLNRETPVVMLTSRSGSFDKIKGTLAGCDAYLVKPINHNEFDEIYSKHMHKPRLNGTTGEHAHVG